MERSDASRALSGVVIACKSSTKAAWRSPACKSVAAASTASRTVREVMRQIICLADYRHHRLWIPAVRPEVGSRLHTVGEASRLRPRNIWNALGPHRRPRSPSWSRDVQQIKSGACAVAACKMETARLGYNRLSGGANDELRVAASLLCHR